MRLAALALLGRRDLSSGELQEKLLSLGYAADPIADILLELSEERLIDDERFAAQFVAMHAGRGHGPQRIRQLLKTAGLPADHIETALDAEIDWTNLARDLRTRKFGTDEPESWKERAKQMRFLQYRGFSNDHIRSAFGTPADLDLEHDSQDPVP